MSPRERSALRETEAESKARKTQRRKQRQRTSQASNHSGPRELGDLSLPPVATMTSLSGVPCKRCRCQDGKNALITRSTPCLRGQSKRQSEVGSICNLKLTAEERQTQVTNQRLQLAPLRHATVHKRAGLVGCPRQNTICSFVAG